MNNVLEVYDRCSGCGLCESICPCSAISMEVQERAFRPVVNNACINCGKCIKNCPNQSMEKCTYEDFQYYYWGHSLNDKLRQEAASGGITSELLVYLLRKKLVDYVVTADGYRDDENGRFCFCDSENIFEKAGSNYCPVNIGAALKEIAKREGTCAIVCLPCLARGIRRLCEQDLALKSKIKFVITLLCNHVPTYNATEYLKKKYNLPSADLIKYRGDGWFGFYRMYKKSREGYEEYFRIPFGEYYSPVFTYFWQRGCIECQDHFGHYADIAMGDADFVKGRSGDDNIGETMCFVNNPEMNQILQDMCKEGFIELSADCSTEELDKIYGSLGTSNRADERNLNQNYMRIIRRERRQRLLRKMHLGRAFRALVRKSLNKVKSHNK